MCYILTHQKPCINSSADSICPSKRIPQTSSSLNQSYSKSVCFSSKGFPSNQCTLYYNLRCIHKLHWDSGVSFKSLLTEHSHALTLVYTHTHTHTHTPLSSFSFPSIPVSESMGKGETWLIARWKVPTTERRLPSSLSRHSTATWIQRYVSMVSVGKRKAPLTIALGIPAHSLGGLDCH